MVRAAKMCKTARQVRPALHCSLFVVATVCVLCRRPNVPLMTAKAALATTNAALRVNVFLRVRAAPRWLRQPMVARRARLSSAGMVLVCRAHLHALN